MAQKTTSINLRDILTVKGYTPNPVQKQAYVFIVNKLAVADIVGITGDHPIQVAIASAELPATNPATSIYGQKIILVDKKTAKLANSFFHKKVLLAMLEYENSIIYGTDIQQVSRMGEIKIVDGPDRVSQILVVGEKYGFRVARAAANRQNKTIDKSCKPIVKQLKKAHKRGGEAESDNAIVDPFQILAGAK